MAAMTQAERSRLWRLRHPEKKPVYDPERARGYRETRRLWRLRHPERARGYRETRRRWYWRNKARIDEAWRLANRKTQESAARAGELWEASELLILADLYRSGATYINMANSLGRSLSAVNLRIYQLRKNTF
jgi:hypothetical protein